MIPSHDRPGEGPPTRAQPALLTLHSFAVPLVRLRKSLSLNRLPEITADPPECPPQHATNATAQLAQGVRFSQSAPPWLLRNR